MTGGAGISEVASDGRGYNELKAELESIQAIIMDDSNKYHKRKKKKERLIKRIKRYYFEKKKIHRKAKRGCQH